jgi:peptidoglycan/xylan/chitin deacetylase (PgdA/CDA1 family)
MGWRERQMRHGLTILTYHRILPLEKCVNYPLVSLALPTEVFQRQIHFLAEHCHVMPVRDAVKALEGEGPFAKPLVAVTFDDGYADNFELAAPVLEKYNLRGTFFVSSGFVEKGQIQWFDQAADAWQRISKDDRIGLMNQGRFMTAKLNKERILDTKIWMSCLKQAEPAARIKLIKRAETLASGSINPELYRPMTPRQVTELHRRGHEIASHTATHPILPQLADEQIQDELRRSATQLYQWTGDKIAGFCYPNGDFDSRVERAVTKAGYSYACIVGSGMNRPDACLTRLARLPITMRRTMRAGSRHDALGFRAELCRVRELWRW